MKSKVTIIIKILLITTILIIAIGTISNARELSVYEIDEYFLDFALNYDTTASATEKEKYIDNYLKKLESINTGNQPKYTSEDLEDAMQYLYQDNSTSKTLKNKISDALTNISSYKEKQNKEKETTGNESNQNNSQDNKGITSFSDWFKQATDFLKIGSAGAQITTDEAIESFIPIGRVLVGIATIVLVAVGGIMGVKYMMAGANDKAQMKEKLIYYVIAVVLVYGAVGIFSIVVNVMNNIFG